MTVSNAAKSIVSILPMQIVQAKDATKNDQLPQVLIIG